MTAGALEIVGAVGTAFVMGFNSLSTTIAKNFPQADAASQTIELSDSSTWESYSSEEIKELEVTFPEDALVSEDSITKVLTIKKASAPKLNYHISFEKVSLGQKQADRILKDNMSLSDFLQAEESVGFFNIYKELGSGSYLNIIVSSVGTEEINFMEEVKEIIRLTNFKN